MKRKKKKGCVMDDGGIDEEYEI